MFITASVNNFQRCCLFINLTETWQWYCVLLAVVIKFYEAEL